MVPKVFDQEGHSQVRFGTILFNMVPKGSRVLSDRSRSFGIILFIMVPKEAFKDFKKEYLEKLGSEAKEEYNKALKL